MLAELRPLWRIAWPLLIAQTAQIGIGVVDTLMAGNYGDVDLAAIAVGFNTVSYTHLTLPTTDRV